MHLRRSILLACAACTVLFSGAAEAQVTQVGSGSFTPQAGVITFSEYAVGTTNPTYAPANYGGGASAPTVTFGGYFVGQSLSLNPSVDCPGAAATACVVGTPTSPLTIASASPFTRIVADGANPTSPVLSGSPTFNGPIAVLFSADQAGVGFDGGFFDAVGTTAITAFDRNGNLLGSVSNSTTGIQFLGLVTSNGQNQIAGVFLDLVGGEPAGFAIDNLRFGVQGQVAGAVPEPSTWAMMLLGFGAIGATMRRRRSCARRLLQIG